MEKRGGMGLKAQMTPKGTPQCLGMLEIREERMLALGSGGNGPWGAGDSRWVVHEAPWRTHLCTTMEGLGQHWNLRAAFTVCQKIIAGGWG